jgi:hypothetical protein
VRGGVEREGVVGGNCGKGAEMEKFDQRANGNGSVVMLLSVYE